MADTATLTLTEFLLARIAEDEAVARQYPGIGAVKDRWELGIAMDRDWCEPTDVTIDPARVVAECDAKRRIVENFQALQSDYAVTRDPITAARRFQALVSVGELAIAYADHPDYQQDWKP